MTKHATEIAFPEHVLDEPEHDPMCEGCGVVDVAACSPHDVDGQVRMLCARCTAGPCAICGAVERGDEVTEQDSEGTWFHPFCDEQDRRVCLPGIGGGEGGRFGR